MSCGSHPIGYSSERLAKISRSRDTSGSHKNHSSQGSINKALRRHPLCTDLPHTRQLPSAWSGWPASYVIRYRTKDISNVPCPTSKNDADRMTFITCSNDGFIKVWSFDAKTLKHKLLAEANTTCRITCLTVSVRPSSSASPLSDTPQNKVKPKNKRQAGTAEDGKKKKKQTTKK